jgi:Cof subfamily protein (haloacid dehalogenase superfamily)
MTAIRLLALDLDGTVLTPDLQISERTRGAVGAVQARGVLVVLATGRMYRSTLRYALALGLPGPLICYQGGYIREMPAADGSPGELLMHRQMPAEAARAAVAWSRQQGLDPHINIGDRLLVGRGPDDSPDYERMAGVGPEYVADLHGAIDGPVTKVLAVGPPGLPREVLEASRRVFAGRLEVTVSHPEYLEFMPLGVTKASGVAFVAERSGIPMSAVMAMGDQSNDLEMLRDVGLGVAMGDAPSEVKAAADEVTGGVDDDGVAAAIERHILAVTAR